MADGQEITDQQLQVLRFLAEGLTYGRIAHRMHVSFSTVRDYASHMYRRLGVHNAPHAVAVGYQRGLLTLPEMCGWTLDQVAALLFDRTTEQVPSG